MRRILTGLAVLMTIVAMSIPSIAQRETPTGNTVYSWADLVISSYGQSSATFQSSEHLGDNPNTENTQVLSGIFRDQSGISWTTPVKGGTMDISVKVWTTGWSEYLNIWIDWDGNGTFDSDEQVVDDYRSYSAGYTTVTFTGVPVPSDAVDSTYLRAELGWGHDPAPIDSWYWGDVEDYEITIGGGLGAPEFLTPAIALAVLLTTPAFAYLLVRKK